MSRSVVASLAALWLSGAACTGSIQSDQTPAEGLSRGGATATTSGARDRPAAAGVGAGGAGAQLPAAHPVPGDVPGACSVRFPLRRLTPTQLRHAIADLWKGRVRPAGPPAALDLGSSATGYSSDTSLDEVTMAAVADLVSDSEALAVEVVAALPSLLPCAAASPDQRCAASFVEEFGTRAFRRPLTAAQRTRLLAVHAAAAAGPAAFTDGMALVAATLMQAPEFLYLPEVAPGGLDDHEIAARLSFALWDAPADATLAALATAGRLRDATVLRTQAERLLAAPAARAVLIRFVREWLHVRPVEAGDRKNARFTEALARAIQQELDEFVWRQWSSGTFASVLSSSQTYVDQTLAAFHELPTAGLPAGELRPVTADASRRAGLLTMPAFLASAAHDDKPSYVERGVTVLRQVVCAVLPPPLPDALAMAPAIPPGSSQRRQSELIRQLPVCNTCHQRVDPVGLAFEAYDETGRFRTRLPDGTGVDTTGQLTGISPLLDGAFRSPVELAHKLASSDEARDCLGRQLFRFLSGRHETAADQCAITAALARMDAGGGRLSALLVALTTGQELRSTAGGSRP